MRTLVAALALGLSVAAVLFLYKSRRKSSVSTSAVVAEPPSDTPLSNTTTTDATTRALPPAALSPIVTPNPPPSPAVPIDADALALLRRMLTPFSSDNEVKRHLKASLSSFRANVLQVRGLQLRVVVVGGGRSAHSIPSHPLHLP